MKDLIPRIEAVLFASSEPVSREKLLKEFGIERTLLLQVIEFLKGIAEKVPSSKQSIAFLIYISIYVNL